MDKQNILATLKNEKLNSAEISELLWLLNEPYYKERPVTIEEFYSSTDFIAKKWPNIFPLWKKTLKELYPTPFNAPYNEVLISAAAGAGKATSLDTNLLTLNGYKLMKDIELNDELIDSKGNPCKVTAIYPQPEKDIYRITFEDRTYIDVSEDHLNPVYRYHQKKKCNEYFVLDTKQLINLFNTSPYTLRVEVPVIDCWEDKDITIDPYLLGALIGDACLKFNRIDFSNSEQDVIDKVNNKLKDEGYELQQVKQYNYLAKQLYKLDSNTCLMSKIKQLGLDCKSEHKFIPKQYLYSSKETRIALLQGLFDTDGWIQLQQSKRGCGCCISFSTSSPQLSEDFGFLVRSLGCVDTVSKRDSFYTDENGKHQALPSYRHYLRVPKDLQFCTSEKHLSRRKAKQTEPLRRIKSIEFLKKDKCQCITVDSPEHTFLVNELIPTHNTVTATISILYDIYKLGCLKDPCSFYGLTPDTMIIMAIFSATASTAAVNWNDITTGIESCPWIMDKIVDKRGLEKKYGSIVPVEIVPGIFIQTGSKFQHSMGKAIFDGLMDEAAFGGANMKDAQKSYNELSSRIKTRFSNWGTKGNIPGHLFLISSPKEAGDFMQHRIEKAKESGSTLTKILQNIATWEADPRKDSDDKFTVFIGNENKEPCIYEPDEDVPFEEMDYLIYPPMRYYDDFKKDLLISIMNYGGITTTSDMALFKSPTLLNDVFILNNPFNMDVIELPFAKTDKQLMDYCNIDYFKNIRHPDQNRFIHLDAAFSTNTLDVYGLAAGYCVESNNITFSNEEAQGMVDESDVFSKKDRNYFIDFVVGITAPKGQEVPLYKVQDFIEYLIKNVGYPVASISADTFQSKQTLQTLETKGFNTCNVSVDKSRDPYLFLRMLVHNKQIIMAKNDYLKTELRKLRDDGKKVDHPSTHHKDLADAVCGCIWNCANSNNIVNNTKIARQVLSEMETTTFQPQPYHSVEMMEFDRLKQQFSNNLFNSFS